MMNSLYEYLTSEGYEEVYIDFHPELSDNFIALYCWENRPGSVYDGTSTLMVQIRVKRKHTEYDEAMRVCTEITKLLDSGYDERPIPLDRPGVVIGRTRRFPIVMERTENAITVYSEISLWGMN